MPIVVECSDAQAQPADTQDLIVGDAPARPRLPNRGSHEHWVSTRMSAEPVSHAVEITPETAAEELSSQAAPPQKKRNNASMGTHWLSANMSADPAPGPWTLPSEPPASAPPVRDALARIEALEDKLSAAEAAPTVPRSAIASPVLYEPPPFLGDADEKPGTPNLPALIPPPAQEPPLISSPKLGWGMAAAACALAVFAGGIAHTHKTTRDSSACTGASCASPAATMSSLMSRASVAQSVAPGLAIAPGLAVADPPSSVVAPAEPAFDPTGFDPVETITVRGVPPEVRLSAGQKISDTDWSLAPNELSNVGFVVPYGRADPVRAEIEFKSRQGIVMARLGLGIVNEPPPPPVEVAVVKEVEPTCLGESCGTLSASMYSIAANPTPPREDLSNPGIVLVTGLDAIGRAPEPAIEQAESVTVSGLPPNVELSAGERISETDWKIASAEVADVDVVIPHDQIEPVRADIEFKSDEGFVMARLGLDIVHAQPPPAAEVATEPADTRGATEPQKSEPPPAAIRPAPRAKKGRAAAVKPQPASAATPRKTAAPAIPPRGLFQFEPPQKSAKQKSAPPPKADAKKPEKKAQAPAVETQASAAPVVAEQAPGFRIQSTLDRPN
jgi:hypothetical protein